MNKYAHIAEMEAILDNHERKLKALNELLDYLESNRENYNRLMDYYYSDQRQKDLNDEEKRLMDATLKRGVLSEDAIYNLIADNYQSCIKMLELSTSYLKPR